MSPLGHAAAHNTPSFPRVSGDEPPRLLGTTAARRFSPRERG